MPLRLSIENIPALPDGGPVNFEVGGKRGLDIGRDQYLDWVLPDPNRVVSGKHAEIRYQDGAYWLRDVSTNGTFVNQNPRRLTEPHRLRHGDRVEIGHYIIRVELSGEEAAADGGGVAPETGGTWDVDTAAPPESPLSFKAPPKPSLLAADPLDHWLGHTPIAPAPPPPLPAAAGPAADLWAIPEHGRQDPTPPPRRRAPMPPAELPEHVQVFGGTAVAPAPAPVPMPVPPAAPAPAPPPPAPVVVAPPSPPPPVPMAPVAPVVVAAPAPAPVAAPSPVVVAPPLAAAPAPAVPSAQANSEFIRRFADGAGIEPESVFPRDAGDLAELLGILMSVCAGNVAQLLAARAQSKSAMRSASQTLIQLQGNNPLRWAPTPQDALKLMFGRPTPSYTDAANAFERSFETLKNHQIDTFSSLQEAIQVLLADLDPAVIQRAVGGDAKKGVLFGGDRAQKAKLWDEFVARWKSKTGSHDGGMFAAFMRVFGEAYDRKAD